MDVDHGLLLERSESLLIDILLESSEGHPFDILDTEPHPSDLILALFSAAVYVEKKSEETDAVYEERLDLPDGWRLLLTGSNPDLTNGYFGAGFIHTELQQLVVAHRGTIATKVGPLYTDFIGIFKNKYTSCMNSAVTFIDKIRQVIHLVNSEHGRHYNLTVTGHSLGGWLAQITGFTFKWLKVSAGALKKYNSGVHAKIVVFDSPGAKNILDKIRVDYFTNYGVNILARLDITVYLSAPNSINTCGIHLGTVYRVLIDFSEYDWKDMKPGAYTEKTHAISNFVEAFKKNSSNISEVLDWAKDFKEYCSLFEDQTLNPGNNYHADFENIKTEFLDKIIKHYNVLAPSNSSSMHLNAFSEAELPILYQLIIFLNQSDFKVFNKFLASQNLVFKNDKIFPDFKINHANLTIKCQSKQLLEELTRRLKQLMRWLGPQFTKAVEEQIVKFPGAVDTFYRAEGESYLDLLPRSTLDFTDSIGLRDFLLSDTKRVLSIVTLNGAFEMTRLRNVFSQIKDEFDESHPINKYTDKNHHTFLDWPRLQKLFKIDGSPIDQNNLMMVDCSSSSTISSDLRTFLKNYVQCSPTDLKKLVFISSHQIDILNSFEHTQKFITESQINCLDLSNESQKKLLQRRLIIAGNALMISSIKEFLGEKCSITEINLLLSSNTLKKIATDEDYFILIKDTRPLISDLQMPLIKTNIATSKEHVLNCINSPDSLVVISGLDRGDLETGADWQQFAGKEFIFADGDVELFFKDTCDKNQNKKIYLIEVSGTEVYCKQIFDSGFYVPRKFIHRACIDLQQFTEVMHMHSDDIFVICSEEHQASLLELIENSEKRKDFSKKLQIAATKECEADVIQKNVKKNIHFVKIEQSLKGFELEWRFSHGSVKNLLSFMSTDSFEPIDELTLSRTERNMVIITDEPGMGKTTSLARLSRLIETAWVIYLELKQFKAHIDRLSDDLNPKNVASFLLSESNSSADDSLANGFLEYLIQSETCSKRVVLMFDGFDELDDYIKNKDSSKGKLIRLLAFLNSKPTIQVFLTARKYLKESLEIKLSQFSTSFAAIQTQEQQDFLFMFWRSFLPLELGINREQEEGRLKEYAGEVLHRAKQVLGPDMDSFMGIPLQLRMLAEVFRPLSHLLLQSTDILVKHIDIVNGPNLYRRFMRQKYEIYLHHKTLIGSALDNDDINKKYLEPLTKAHGELGFRSLFPDFYDKYFEAITDQELNKLNRIGIIQSNGNGDFQFVHRTYAEYCCAQIVVQWLNQRERFQQDSIFKYQLIKDLVLPQILLHVDSKVIRLFMNVELDEIAMSDATLKLNAEHINRLWCETNNIFRDAEHQTALHIAVQERNENIFKYLLSGLDVKNTQEAFIYFFTQYNNDNNMALHLMDQPTVNGKTEENSISLNIKIMEIFLKYIESLSHESKEYILFACLFNRDISKSYVSNYLLTSDYVSDDISSVLKKVVTRVKEVKLEIIPLKKALLRNNVKLATKILSERLTNNIERYCFLLVKQRKHGMYNSFHLAAKRGLLGVVKLLVEQNPHLFTTLMTRYDDDRMIPLHAAAVRGHLNIVKFLLERGADINARCKKEKTALMYAVAKRHTPTLEYLIERGADINCKDDFGFTALYIASGYRNLSIVKYLIASGADVNSKSNAGSTALHPAAFSGNESIVKYLIESGVETGTYDFIGRTVLHLVAEMGNLQIVQCLIEGGVDIESLDRFGKTALYVAKRHPRVVDYLLQRGANPDRLDLKGWTAVTAASQERRWDTVRVLVNGGANVNADGGKTLCEAIRLGEWSMVEYLVNIGASVLEYNVRSNLSQFKKRFPDFKFRHPFVSPARFRFQGTHRHVPHHFGGIRPQWERRF